MSNGLRTRSIGIARTEFVTTPRHGKRKAAEFAQLCGALMRRREMVSPDFYLGGVRHLMGKFGQMPGNENGGKLYSVIDRGMVSRDVIDGCMSAAREAGDGDAFALGRLLLSLTDEQLEAL